MKKTISGLVLATLLAACGGAGGGAPQRVTASAATTTTPVVAGTEAPKEYPAGKTAGPSSSPDDYMGY